MSAIDDNKTFLTSVIGAGNVDFENHVYGLWVSVFENLNHSTNGYSYPTPIINDLLSIDYAITGKTFSVFNTDGRKPDVKFFITSGVKGSAFYETNDIAADISDSYMSGYDPLVIMPDMDFAGKIYRKQQITGLKPSLIGNYDILNISGEDWINTSITVNAGNSDVEYAYSDSNYVGYSNEVETKYKFLYDDSNNSINEQLSVFEIPIQVELGTNLRYRISRKSDPLGEYFSPQINSDGKMVIDYTNYKDEVTEPADSNLSYDFNNIYSVVLDQESLSQVSNGENLTRSINDNYINSLKVSKSTLADGRGVFNFSISPTSSFSDIYKLNFSFDRFNISDKRDVEGYVLTGIKTGVSKEVISLSVGSNVYPRNIQSNNYDSKDLLKLANEADLSLYEGLRDSQDLITDTSNTSDQEEFHQFIEDFNDFIVEDPLDAPAQDNPIILEKVDLPLLTLPKDQVTKDYYSNYLNSGESYIGIPFSQYSRDPNYDILHFGNQVGFIGYFINNSTRTVENPSSEGIFINKKEPCLGENPRDESIENQIKFLSGKSILGAKTSLGEFKKQDYVDQSNWYNAINYFYTKTTLYSCDIFPDNSDQSNQTAFSEALGRAYEAAGDGGGSFAGNKARVFVEREIYVEPYFSDQASLLNDSINNKIISSSFTDLSSETREKLYAVQVFGGEFSRTKSDYFYQAQDYEESLSFSKFIPYKDKSGTQKVFYNEFSQGKAVHSSEEISEDSKKVYRLEYVIGTAFTEANLSATTSQIYQTKQPSVDSEIAEITNKDTSLYAYHLYGYNSTSDQLTFIKSNVYQGFPISGISFNYVCVVRFFKKDFDNEISQFTLTSESNSTNVISATVLNSSDVEYDTNNLFFNIQVYDYKLDVKTSDTSWFTNKLTPYNNDIFGKDEDATQQTFSQTQDSQVIKFFEDTTSDVTKQLGIQLSSYPNGPASSKNYEGVVVTQSNLASFINGALKNTLVLTEEGASSSKSSYRNNLILNLKGTNGVIKEKPITEKNAAFNEIVRLKISRIRYNFYIKDLVILGDAGFPEMRGLNLGWEYKLQYKHKNNADWIELPNSSSLSNASIQTTTEFPNPFIAKQNQIEAISYFSDKNNCYLPTVAFKNNIPRYLNDADYVFRVLKYEKLNAVTDSVNIIRKTNFLPIKASWSSNSSAEYYNIYQVDTGENVSLLNSVEGTNYNVLPNVKQDYVNSGVADFPVNGQGYYDILVSGVVPSEKTNSSAISNFFDSNSIGDDTNGQEPTVNVVQNNTYNNEYIQVSNVSYEPLINFNNPEGREGEFTIDAKYDDYYFVAYDSNITLNNLTDDFKCFILNTGVANNSITVGNSTVSIASNKGFYMNSTSVTGEYSLSSLPSNQTELSAGDFLKVSSNTTVVAASSSTFQATIINESNSQITITYGSNTINLAANETKKINFSSSSITSDTAYANQTIQTENIQSNNDLVNLSYQELSLTSSVTEMAVYNANISNLKINSSLDLANNSFNLVSWDGVSSPTASLKNQFDTIRIYLDNSSQEIENYLLVDDTEIIVSNFSSLGSDAVKDYLFVKSSNLNRNIQVKVINGSNEEVLDFDSSEAFKLTVARIGNNIDYKVVYATYGFGVALSDEKEQLIVLKDSDTRVSFESIRKNLKTGAFLYLINKTNNPLSVTDASGNNVNIEVNSVFKFYLDKNNSTLNHLNLTEESSNHLYFDLAGADMTSSINLINLRACNTEILVPTVANFALGDSYLFIKNTNGFNQINEDDFIEDGSYEPTTNNQGKLSNYRAFKLYKYSPSDTKGTIQPIEVENFNSSPVFNNYLNEEYNVVYIDDSNLDKVTIPDRFERYNKNSGKIITETQKSLRVFSFNELDSYDLEKNNSFDYKFDLGNSPDGAFFAFTAESPTVVFNSASENSSQKTLSALNSDQYYVNFAYTSVQVSSTYVYKNRILKTGPLFYAIYNNAEFFIASSKLNNPLDYKSGSNYFYDINADCDINYVVLPQTSSDGYVINNTSSRRIPVKALNSDTIIYTILPSEKKRFSYSSVWSVANSTLSVARPLEIKLVNQDQELDSNHAFLSIFENNTYLAGDAIRDYFINNSDLTINGTSFSFYDNDSESNTTSTSNVIVCMGRKGPDVSDKNIVNNFYLYCPVSKKDYWSTSVVKNGQYYINENVRDFYKLKRESVDILSFFSDGGYEFNIDLVGDTLVIPFYRDLVDFHLPNLNTQIQLGSTTQTVGAWLNNKKIIFVNCVDTSSASPNKVYNSSYSSLPVAELSNLNDVAIFSVSNSSSWVKQTSNLPEMQNYNPSLRNLKGIKYNSNSPDLSGKNEFLNLPNVDGFDISIDSFSDETFGDIYVYNSCARKLNIRTRDLPQGDSLTYNKVRGAWLNPVQTEASSFIKLKYDGSRSDYIPQSLTYQPTTSKFAVVESQEDLSDDLEVGSLAVEGGYLYRKEEDGWTEENYGGINDLNTGLLDLNKLTTYDSNYKLFIYGISAKNTSNQNVSDKYILKIVVGQLKDNLPFYIFNKNTEPMLLSIANGDTSLDLELPSFRMLKVDNKQAVYTEIHNKGMFYLSARNSNKNFIQAENSKIIFDLAKIYNISEGLPVYEVFQNNLITINSDSACDITTYKETNAASLEKLESTPLSAKSVHTFTNSSLNTLNQTFKQITFNISAAGHYLLTDPDTNFKVTPPASDYIYLINNTSKNISYRSSSTQTSSVIYRNTTLVLDSQGSVSYLKKAKSRDEFYSVLNTKALINTEEEVAASEKLISESEFAPIYKDNSQVQSYIKLISRSGQESKINLSLKEYYYGKDIPSNTFSNVVAYEIGLGHETIHKFLFFDPSTNFYTLPGIENGESYQVKVTNAFFNKTEDNIEGKIKYMGKEYRNGEIFKGKKSSWYEVNIPEFVQLSKIIQELPSGFSESNSVENEEGIDSIPVTDGESENTELILLKEEALKQLPKKLSLKTDQNARATLCWIPEDEEAFWLEDDYTKNMWKVQSIEDSEVSISVTENNQTHELYFKKCKMEKQGLRTPLYNNFDVKQSAFQNKVLLSNTEDVTIGFDYNLTETQKGALKKNVRADYEKQDNIPSDGLSFTFMTILESDVFPQDPENAYAGSTFEINISLEKLNANPKINIEDFSLNQTVKILNNET